MTKIIRVILFGNIFPVLTDYVGEDNEVCVCGRYYRGTKYLENYDVKLELFDRVRNTTDLSNTLQSYELDMVKPTAIICFGVLSEQSIGTLNREYNSNILKILVDAQPVVFIEGVHYIKKTNFDDIFTDVVQLVLDSKIGLDDIAHIEQSDIQYWYGMCNIL